MAAGVDSVVTDVELEVVELASVEIEECGVASERTVGKSRRSVVWRYFNKLPRDDAGSKCTLCGHVLRDCGNTTNLFKVAQIIP